ncbi:MAG: two-component regulator propeller domain-containing protein, partial [Bacteroidia bacterium]
RLKATDASDIVENDPYSMWIATKGDGLYLYNRQDRSLTKYRHNSSNHSLINNNVQCLFKDSRNRLWAATENGGISILEKASVIAQKNELFAEQILIDELCRNYNLLKSGEKVFSSFMKRIETNTSLLEKVQFAKYFHYEMTAAKLFKTANTHPLEEWSAKLQIIKEDYEQTKSVKIGFYYNLSALNYYREIHQFEKSLEFGLKFLKNSENNEILKTPYYSGKINMELAKCFLLTEDYEKAVHYASISNKYFEKDILNELSSLEILLYCHLMKQDFNKVNSVMEKAFTKVSMQPNEFIYSKWCFLKAGVEFRMNDFPAALKSLKSCTELLKDKNGWLLAYNLFEAICRIENGNMEWFEYRADALKKMIQRYNNGHAEGQNKRFYLIYKVLRTLHKNCYDYVQTIADEMDDLKTLSQISYSYSLYMSGYEPIQFDRWIKEKAENQLKNKKGKSKLVA